LTAPESLPAPAPKRVNLTDPDSVMLTTKEGATQVGYNVMQAVDSQHKLIVAHEVTTQRNDHASLQPMALAAQQALQVPALTAVCDTGFMNGEQSDACEALGITPVVPMARPSNTRNAQLYAKALFRYDSALGAYHCPANQILTRYKRDKTAKTDYYTTRACESCALKSKCTESKQRSIARSWFADAAERAHQRAQERTLMKLRSATVEHPFGNLKAMMPGGFLTRTLPKVQGEMALAVLAYNIKRVLSILGFAQLMEKLAAMQQLQPV
jgi:hypothetical protein